MMRSQSLLEESSNADDAQSAGHRRGRAGRLCCGRLRAAAGGPDPRRGPGVAQVGRHGRSRRQGCQRVRALQGQRRQPPTPVQRSRARCSDDAPARRAARAPARRLRPPRADRHLPRMHLPARCERQRARAGLDLRRDRRRDLRIPPWQKPNPRPSPSRAAATSSASTSSPAALTVGGNTPFSKEFRLGHGWWTMWLHIAITVTIGTGAGVLSDGLLRAIRKIFFKTDRGELICNEPGRAMFYIATYRMGTKPQISTLAAASGTYDVFIPILFADEDMIRPEDTILDTSRYKALDLEIQLGTTADLYSTPGTSSMTATLDIDVERTYGALPDKAKPAFFISYDHRPPQD